VLADAGDIQAILLPVIAGNDWRQTHVSFTIGGDNTDLAAMLNRVWDGMRPLPYTGRQIAMAIFGTYLRSPPPYESLLDGEFISVEMGGMNGQFTRINCSRAGLRRALRPDIDDVLAVDRRGERT
jgi:hypothetical protein